MSKWYVPALALALAFVLAPPALAQTGMIKGKVTDAEGKPVAGAQIVIEFADGVNRKFEVKTDRRGEFIQIGLQTGSYKVTATADKLGTMTQTQRVALGKPAEFNFAFVPGAAGADPAAVAKATELKKNFDEGVAASKANNQDLAIEKFTAAAAASPNCFDCYYNIGFAYSQKKDEKQAETAWLKALEIKPDYTRGPQRAGHALQQPEALRRSGGDEREGGHGGRRLRRQRGRGLQPGHHPLEPGQDPEAKAKFEEALKANPNHAESHFQLGMALLNEGKLPDAIASFEKYLQLAPSGQFAAQAKGMLAQLKK